MSGIGFPNNLNPETSKVLDNRCAGPSTATDSIAFPAQGLLRYETDNDNWKYYDNTNNWVDLSTGVTYTGGEGVNIDDNVINIGQSVATNDSPSFNQLSLGVTGTNKGIINLKDITNIGTQTVAQIKGINEGTNGGKLQFFTKADNGPLTERLSILESGLVKITTNSTGLVIASADGVSEQGYIYHSQTSADKDFVIDAFSHQPPHPIPPNKGIVFRTGGGLNIDGVDRMRIRADGRVGINTIIPGGLLEVKNDSTQSMLYSTTGNLSLFDPEGAAGVEVRLGAAWGRPGVYSSGRLELQSRNTGIIFGDTNAEKMRMNASGAITLESDSGDCRFRNARIGNLYSDSHASFSAANYFSEYNYAILQSNSEGHTYVNAPASASLHLRNNNINKMIINAGGVGIGTSTPYFPLHVVGRSGGTNFGYRRWFSYNIGLTPDQAAGGEASIYASHDITIGGYFISAQGAANVSDERIKKDISDINDGDALNILRLLKPKKYSYKDTISRGSEPVWGFIAQEVRDTLPYATFKKNDFIPNIYELANVSSSNVITFTNFNTSDLESHTNALIRIMDINDKEHNIHLTEIIDEHSIRVEEDLDEWSGSVDESGNVIQGSQIFVYGEEVHDFHVLKKDAIFTAATAALQEVDRQQQADKARISDLETQLALVLTRLEALENA